MNKSITTMFTLKSLTLLEGCKYNKNLLINHEYKFEHTVCEDFFAKNICISAIVGKNGSGKSSLLDMIFRIVNNFGYCLFSNITSTNSYPYTYIHDIFADLKYVKDGVEGCIHVRDGLVAFEYGSDKNRFILYPSDGLEIIGDFEGSTDFANFQLNKSKNIDYCRQKEFAKNLFFTIATNYSMQAFVADDYRDEAALPYTQKGNSDVMMPSSWLNHLFHKNDGYNYPIVLNPFRDNGIVDMNNENELTISRLAAILIEENPSCPLIEGYEYGSLKLSFNPEKLHSKFTKEDGKTPLYPTEKMVGEHNRKFLNDKWTYKKITDDFKQLSDNQDSYAYQILDMLGCRIYDPNDKVQLNARIYVVYKMFSIAEKYPSYSAFRDWFGNINLTFKKITDVHVGLMQAPKANKIARLKQLVNTIKADKSHIGLKFQQAINFIKNSQRFKRLIINDVFHHLSFSYEEYTKQLGIEAKGMSIEKRMLNLPPSIFKYELNLKKKDSGEILPIHKLSSGERQLLYLLSTLLYHANNIKSIPNDGTRIKYSNLNLVLDEVEICFHPEYQRTFIKKLVDTLTRTKLNEDFDINILLTTHSPFILSDIPQSNVLYLEDGKDLSNTMKLNTFGSNIGDLLNQSFFLKEGFMGAFAQNKIKDVISFLKHEDQNSITNVEEAKKVIDIVGFPVLQDSLYKLYEEYGNSSLSNAEQRKKRIEELQAELDLLRKEEKYEAN